MESGTRMKAQLINPFITAANEVLSKEANVSVERDGPLKMTTDGVNPQDVTALIGVTGKIKGVVLYSMSQEMAIGVFGAMMGEPVTELDDLGRSAIGELGNMITGHAAILLEEAGYTCDLSPPTIIEGRGIHISSLTTPTVALPLKTELGKMQINVGLAEN
jgi:chemotaxis protein CheX